MASVPAPHFGVRPQQPTAFQHPSAVQWHLPHCAPAPQWEQPSPVPQGNSIRRRHERTPSGNLFFDTRQQHELSMRSIIQEASRAFHAPASGAFPAQAAETVKPTPAVLSPPTPSQAHIAFPSSPIAVPPPSQVPVTFQGAPAAMPPPTQAPVLPTAQIVVPPTAVEVEVEVVTPTASSLEGAIQVSSLDESVPTAPMDSSPAATNVDSAASPVGTSSMGFISGLDSVRKDLDGDLAEVVLHCYAAKAGTFVNGRWQRSMGNETLHTLRSHVLGIYHHGIVVRGKEYTFGSARGKDSVKVGIADSGVYSHEPKQAGICHEFTGAVSLGFTSFSTEQLEEMLAQLGCETYGASRYSRIGLNCVDFSRDVAEKLGVDQPPAWTSRALDAYRLVASAMP